ncbi:MAG: diguanylate cyclase, partial [Clostridia bacterium]|nr:diguanylate cyclase [Clostridia bacterium]
MIIFSILLIRDIFSGDRQERQIKFDHALVAFMSYFISDAVWSAIIAGVIPRTFTSVVAANFVNYVLMAGVTYMWLRFVMAYEQVPHRERTINKFAVLFPFILATLALIGVYIFAPSVLINEDLTTTMVLNVFLIAVPEIYIVAVLFYTLRKAKVEPNREHKKNHIYIGMFPLIVVGGGMLQVLLLPRTPVYCFSCTILMLILYIKSMEKQISVDPLTGLNNRGQLAKYISQEVNNRKDRRRTFVVMLDVNDFKLVNDTYGHAE